MSLTASVTGDIAVSIILAIFGTVGVAFAAYPRQSNRLRQRLPGQLESADWYIRAFGIAVVGFVLVIVVLLIFFAG